ncbi:MAG TPA: hypothetical protein VJ907_05830 [Halanaerobiales bacterium]|nr:hypothetical protein [Halanaerobiales bacterium]
MALELSLSVSQSNDATHLTVTDNSTGWGDTVGVADIVDVDTTTVDKYHLVLDVIVTDKNNESHTYDTLDLYEIAGGSDFTTTDDLTWNIYADDLVESDTAMGTDEDRLMDGIWSITYSVREAHDITSTEDTYESELIVDGDVRADVYDALREIAKQYDDNINDHIDEIQETLLKFAYLKAIQASASVSEKENLVNMLWTLDKLNSDGSKYDW